MKLSERIKFHTEPQSIGSDEQATKLFKRVKDAAKVDPRWHDRIQSICVLVSCTSEIDFNLAGEQGPHEAILRFRDAWLSRENATTEDWVTFAVYTPDAIINEWLDQWRAQQKLDDLDPAQLPPSKLTAAQQEELKNPNSFLAEQGSSSRNASSSTSRSSGTAMRRQSKRKALSAQTST